MAWLPYNGVKVDPKGRIHRGRCCFEETFDAVSITKVLTHEQDLP